MASSYTEHFQLNQWAAEDPVLREDFNADNAKLDKVIPRIVTGTYTGDGTADRTIYLGFRPKAVILAHESGYTCYYSDGYNCYGGLFMDEVPLRLYNAQGREICAEITDEGFRVRYYDAPTGHIHVYTNFLGQRYHYAAVI